MNANFRILMTLAAAAGATLPALAAPPGEAAPGFMINDASGKAVNLVDYRGKFVVLEWTNPECPFVQKHYTSRNMQTLQKDYLRICDEVGLIPTGGSDFHGAATPDLVLGRGFGGLKVPPETFERILAAMT